MRRIAALLVLLSLVPAAAAREPAGPEWRGKIHAPLHALVKAGDAGRDVDALAARRGVEATPAERVLVAVYVRGEAAPAAELLRGLGMRVLAATDDAPVAFVEGWLGVDRIEGVAKLSITRALRGLGGGETDVGAATSQGDAAHRGPEARALGVTGAGVTVGVISDSINQVGTKLAGSQGSGDLPVGVTVINDDTTAGVIDEGRAMAEIIYDTAPGITSFYFDSGTRGDAATKAAAIDSLVAAGADVIADDIFFVGEPFFQDGTIAQAVDRAKAAGVAYFASAGNRARQSWEGTYANAGGFHDFGGGDTRQTVFTVPNNAFLQVTLQWDEPWGGATTDIDAGFYDADSGGTLLASSTSDNIATGLPIESVTWSNTTGSAVTVRLLIARFAGSRSPFMKYIARGNFGSFTIAEHDTSSDTINPDAASARGALAVAAVEHSEAGLNDPEPFSSRGPKTRLFDAGGTRLSAPLVLQKPQLAGADGVSTTVPALVTFYGTSAATPSAAAIAVLALDAKPALNTDVLYAIMTEPANAIDCTLAGNPDTDCGAGFLLADDAVTQALDPTPPTVSAQVVPATPDGADGWYLQDVSVTFTTADTGSPHVKSGCDPTTIASDQTSTLTCTATSAGGATSVPVTVKRDASAPSVPAFTGIAATTYTPSSVPAASAIGCTAEDATSGVAGCTVTGFDAALGSHTLTATATNGAGLTSTSTLAYTVADGTPPTTPVISGLEARAYLPKDLPAASAVTCSAQDPETGLASCVISGFERTPGRHTATATATNGVGLASTAMVTYTVLPENRFTLKATGVRLSVVLPGAGRLAVTQKTPKRPALVRTVGKTVKGAGRLRLSLRLTDRGAQRLERNGSVTVTVRVRFTPTGGTAATRTVKVLFRN